MNPGGTGNPTFVISARPAPLPPSTSFILPLPSALPPPKKYTYWVDVESAFLADDLSTAPCVMGYNLHIFGFRGCGPEERGAGHGSAIQQDHCGCCRAERAPDHQHRTALRGIGSSYYEYRFKYTGRCAQGHRRFFPTSQTRANQALGFPKSETVCEYSLRFGKFWERPLRFGKFLERPSKPLF